MLAQGWRWFIFNLIFLSHLLLSLPWQGRGALLPSRHLPARQRLRCWILSLPGACPANSICPGVCKSGFCHVPQLKFPIVLAEERRNLAGMGWGLGMR